jgi:uncharacterized membrane protein
MSPRADKIVAGAACAWVLVLSVATAAAALGPPGPLAFSATATVYAAASLICHQRPERSFHLQNAQFPVCARCLGLYVGAAIAACFALGLHRRVPRTLPASGARVLLLAAAIPTLLTLAVETMAAPFSNVSRAAAGVPLGAAIGWILVTTGRLVHQSK